MSDYVVASDLGTGGCKTVVVNERGVVVGSAQSEYPMAYPRLGWCEQNPQDWLNAVCATVRVALAKAGLSPSHIAAFGLVGVTHNAVLLDSSGQPLRPSILIYDTRSQVECDEISARWGDEVFRRTRNTISPFWTWPQLEWLKRHEPDVWTATRTVLFQKDYVRNCLAPSPVSDLIDVEGSLLFDPVADVWIDDFVADLGLPVSALPEVVKPTDVVGRIDAHGADLTTLAVGTPVIAGTTDTAAEIFAAGALRPGQGMVKLASVGRIASVAAGPNDHPNLLNYRHIIDGLWYPGTACKHASSAYRWLRGTMWGNTTYDEMSAAAATVRPGCDGLLFHPHLQGEWVPYWDDRLRGDFIGVTMRHERPHLTRAVMEGVGFALRAGVECMQTLGLPLDDVRLVGQGGTSSLWAQIIADTLNRPILIPAEQDAAYGAALVVGMGIGMFPTEPGAIAKLIRIEEQREPDAARAALYDELFDIYQGADVVLKSISHRLTAFEQKYAGNLSGG
ncbi:MAG: FGGY family carbohydrate kinase [Chloroflexota bacterium]